MELSLLKISHYALPSVVSGSIRNDNLKKAIKDYQLAHDRTYRLQ
jgi:hypothetical protein